MKKLTSDDPAVAWRGTVVEQQVLYCSKIYNEHKNTAHLYTDKFDAGIYSLFQDRMYYSTFW